MSQQDLKDEYKETEGSPELKGMLRRRQYELLNGSARKAIVDASVVVTNPTHFSVALRYRPGEDAVPLVVARGRGETALAIRELADEKGVPVLQYPELARAIYYTSRAGQVINGQLRSEEHTSELQSLMRISYAVFCLKKKNYKDR